MKKLVSATILIITSLLLSSCSNYIRTAIPINISNPGYESFQVAIAVDFFGVKHIARSECPIGTTTNCKLIYARAYSGRVIDFWTWEPGTAYSGVDELDIAVTDEWYCYTRLEYHQNHLGRTATTLYMVANPPLTVQELMPGYAGFRKTFAGLQVQCYLCSQLASWMVHIMHCATARYMGGSASGWVSEHGIAFTSSLAMQRSVLPDHFMWLIDVTRVLISGMRIIMALQEI